VEKVGYSVEKWAESVDKHPFEGWVLVVCNPVSGLGRGLERLGVVQRAFDAKGVSYRAETTARQGDAARLAYSASRAGCSAVVVIGGDGTLFEVVNGVMGFAGPEAGQHGLSLVAVGLVQAGRGSDFGRSVGVPSDVEAACARLLEGRTRTVDLGHVSYTTFSGKPRARYFINAAGMGFDAEVTLRSNAVPRMLGGTVPYLSSLLTTLVTYRNKRLLVSVDKGDARQARANSIIVANGQYFGGGMKIAPDAELSDGLFDVVTLGDLGKIDLVRNVPRVYDGSHITHPKVSVQRASQVEINSPDRLLLQADGEVLGTAPARFTVIPGAIRLIV
jgi:YegS/Rv2252/BmrU family lipid kinase